MSSAPDIKKGFDHFCLGALGEAAPGGAQFSPFARGQIWVCLEGRLPPGQLPEIIWHGME